MLVIETIKQFLPRHKHTPSGWLSFNCPACHYHGHRPDKRGRGGILLDDQNFSYHCFNCGFKTSWRSGLILSKKSVQLMEYLNVPDDLINKCKISTIGLEGIDRVKKTDTRIYQMPKDSRKIMDLVEEGFDHPQFMKVLEYIGSRNINYLDWYPLYYSEEIPNSFIMPVISNGQIVGHVSRTANDYSKKRYSIQVHKHFLFNGDVLYDNYRKFCLITEGNLDAISLDCVATMSNEITDGQLNQLEMTEQIKIILPDKDRSGRNMIDYALDQGWWVSFPEWPCKDAAQAVSQYGRIPSLHHILKSIYKTPLKIKLQAKNYFGSNFER